MPKNINVFYCYGFKSIYVKEVISTLQNVTFKQKILENSGKRSCLLLPAIGSKGFTEITWKKPELLIHPYLI